MGYTLNTRGKPEYNDDAANPGPQGDFQAAVDFAEKVGGVIRLTAAERVLLTSSEIEVGQMVVETDTGRIFKRNAAADWDLVWAGAGTALITPTGVSGSGVSIGPSGEVVLVSVPASTTLQIRGIFSSLFRNYRVISKATSKVTAAAYNVTGIVGTTPITSANYSRTRTGMVLGAAIANNQDVGQTNFGEAWLADGNGTQAASTMDIFSPNLPESTQIITHASLLGTAVGLILFASNLNTTDQLTGLQIVTPPGGTTTAEIRVYGVV